MRKYLFLLSLIIFSLSGFAQFPEPVQPIGGVNNATGIAGKLYVNKTLQIPTDTLVDPLRFGAIASKSGMYYSWDSTSARWMPILGGVEIVEDIPALQAYAGTATTIIVRDTIRGGIFHVKPSGYTHDGGVAFSATGLGGTNIWLRKMTQSTYFNVKWWGAKGDGVAYDRPAQQAANDYVYSKGGGTVFYPKGVYRDTTGVYDNPKVNILGEGPTTSIIRNSRQFQIQGPDQVPMFWGNMTPSLYEALRPFQASLITGNRITLATPSNADSFAHGQIITIRGATGWHNVNGLFDPYYAILNRVDSVLAGGIIVMEDAIDSTLTPGFVGISGHFLPGTPRNGLDERGHITYFASDLTVSNIGFQSEGQWFLRFSGYKINFENTGSYGAELIGGNAMSHCRFRNHKGTFWKQATELSRYSHDSKIEDVEGIWVNRNYLVEGRQPLVSMHENCRNITLLNYIIKAGKESQGPVVNFQNSVNCTIDGLKFWGDSTFPVAVLINAGPDSAHTLNNTLINSEFHLGRRQQTYIEFALDTFTNSIVDGNIVQNCRFYGVVGNEVGNQDIVVRFGGSNNSVIGNYFEKGTLIDIDSVGAVNCIMTGNYMLNPYFSNKLSGVTVTNNFTYNNVEPELGNDTTNTWFGYRAFPYPQIGFDVIAIGKRAAFSSVTLHRSALIGNHAGYSLTTGNDVIAIGDSSQYYNINGSDNVSTGSGSLMRNTTGTNNTAFGSGVLRNSLIASENSGFGKEALFNNTGASNTAGGFRSLYSNTTGIKSTAFGVEALRNATTGTNTALGFQAQYNTTTGNNNTSLGYQTMLANTTGGNNVALGRLALSGNIDGSSNIVIGFSAATNHKTGNNNITIGSNVSSWSWNASNTVNIKNSLFGINISGSDSTTSTNGFWGINIRNPTAFVHLPATTTQRVALRLQGGVSPSNANQNNGNIWFDSTVNHMLARMDDSTYQLDNEGGSIPGSADDSCRTRTFNVATGETINEIEGPVTGENEYTPILDGENILAGKYLFQEVRNNIPDIPGPDYTFNSVAGTISYLQPVNDGENFMFYYTGCLNASDTTVIVPPPPVDTGQTIFGIMIAGNDLNNSEKVDLMDEYGTDYVRIGVMLQQFNGSSTYMNAAEAAGKKVLLNAQWKPVSKDGNGDNIPNEYVQPSEYAQYDTKLNQVLTRYHDIIELVVIENEPTVDHYFGNAPIADYIALLAHAIPVVHAHGLLVADGAIHIELVQGVMAGGGLNANEEQVSDIIDAYPSLNLDYTNFHTHGPNQTTYPINLKNVVDYIRANNGGKPVISNEYHLDASYPSLIQSLVSKMKEANVKYSIPYDAGNGGNGSGISFHNIGQVELNGLGEAYRDAIALP